MPRRRHGPKVSDDAASSGGRDPYSEGALIERIVTLERMLAMHISMGALPNILRKVREQLDDANQWLHRLTGQAYKVEIQGAKVPTVTEIVAFVEGVAVQHAVAGVDTLTVANVQNCDVRDDSPTSSGFSFVSNVVGDLEMELADTSYCPMLPDVAMYEPVAEAVTGTETLTDNCCHVEVIDADSAGQQFMTDVQPHKANTILLGPFSAGIVSGDIASCAHGCFDVQPDVRSHPVLLLRPLWRERLP